jgi:hypothetical protein
MPVPAPPNGRGNGRAIALVAGLAGLAVGAAVVGGAWLLFGNDGGSSTPISAPERVGDYLRFADLRINRENDKAKSTVDARADADRRSSEQLSAANDDAGAFVQQYSDEELENGFSLDVVRAPSPGLYVPYTNPEYLGVEKPIEEVLEFGDVSCAVRNQTSGDTFVSLCLRSDGDLSVTISHLNGDLLQKPEQVAALVDKAWAQLD